MIAEAFADIAAGFSQAFGGPFHDSRVLGETAAVYDDGGSIVTPGVPSNRPCQCQVDGVTEAMRSEAGYADHDVRLLVLTATLEGTLTTDDRVEVLAGPNARLWSVQSVGTDPMGVLWECRGRACGA